VHDGNGKIGPIFVNDEGKASQNKTSVILNNDFNEKTTKF
jgi:hypothetical protein